MVSNFDFENDLIMKLKHGDRVKCPKCGKGFITGIDGVEPSKCHSFSCENCDWHYHWDPLVIVE